MSIFTKATTAITRLFQRKKAVLLWPKWIGKQAQWQLVDQSAFIDEGYNLNSIIYSCISYKARVSKGVRLRAYGGTRDEPELLPADHDLTKLTDRPNPWMSFSELQGLNEVNYNLFGNAYVLAVRERSSDYPIALYSLRPDWVYHIYEHQHTIKGYAYVPGGSSYECALPILAADMLHVKLPHPGDSYAGLGKGMSPLYSLAQSGDVDNSITAYLKMFFDHGAMVQGVLITDQAINQNTSDMLRERWNATHGNWRNWVDPAVLGHGASYQRIGSSFDELDMSALDARNANRIAAPFGVPLVLLFQQPGVVQSTFKNYEQARASFWQDTMIPELQSFEIEWQYMLRGPGGEFVAYDYSAIPALQQARDEHAEVIGQAWERGVALRNEYRAALGLDPVPGGDVFKLPITFQFLPPRERTMEALVPPPATGDDEEGAIAATDEEEEGGREKALPSPWVVLPPRIPLYKAYGVKNLTLEQKLLHYKQFDALAEAWEDKFADEAARQLGRDRRNIMAIVNDTKAKALHAKASVIWQPALFGIIDYLRTNSQPSWRQGFIPLFNAVILEQGAALNAEFGIQFDVRNILAEDWYRQYTMTFSQNIADTTHNTIQDMFNKALAEGWSVDRMEDQLGTLFDQWIDGEVSDAQAAHFALDRLPNWRRRLIARDQTLRASNAGAHNLHKAWGVPMKEWLSTPDDRTRDSHKIGVAWGQEPYIVSIDEPFKVGGCAVMYPGDPDALCLEQIIQCRCQSLPIFPEDINP